MKNITEMTRRQAENFVAVCEDQDELIASMSHKNYHVGRLAFRRGMTMFWGGIFFAQLAQLMALVPCQQEQTKEDEEPITLEPATLRPEESIPEVLRPELAKQSNSELAELALKYGEPLGYVETIAHEKNGDIAAVKRSLISRKAAKTVAAKKASKPSVVAA